MVPNTQNLLLSILHLTIIYALAMIYMFYLHVRNTTEECTSTLLFPALRSAIQSHMNSAPARVFPSLQLEMLQIKAKPSWTLNITSPPLK